MSPHLRHVKRELNATVSPRKRNTDGLGLYRIVFKEEECVSNP